ncbi:MAG TPA: hypothetical protein VFR10_14380, partial [bacterium]|nr:hypothetical protein [bacterium]
STPAALPPPTTAPASTAPPAKPMAPISKYLVSGVINYLWAGGSELEKVDPSFGLRGRFAMNLFSHVSACASIAYNSNSIDGQVAQLMDRYVRPDRRSGHVIGDAKFFRFGGGVRVDAATTADWKYRPYALAELLYAKSDLNIDAVDGAPPAPGVVPFSQWKLGALGEAGIDYGLSPNFSVEVSGNYEFIEFPAGSMFLGGFQAGALYRF